MEKILTPKQSAKWQETIRNMPCCFCQDSRYGFVSWHHLRCLGLAGTRQKPDDIFTIPVCSRCHEMCHSGIFSDTEQRNALINTWRKAAYDKSTNALKSLVDQFLKIDCTYAIGDVKKWEERGKCAAELIL